MLDKHKQHSALYFCQMILFSETEHSFAATFCTQCIIFMTYFLFSDIDRYQDIHTKPVTLWKLLQPVIKDQMS